MAKKSGDYYEGVEPNPENQTRRGSLGALIGLGGRGGQAAPTPEGPAPQMGRMMQPQEDFESLRERNKQFLRDPATQAALLTFATGMLTPVSNNSDLMGLFTNSLMNSARAAAGVEEAQLAQTLAERKMAMEEAEFGLKAGEFDLNQRRFALEQGNAKRTDENADEDRALNIRKQDFEERKFTEEQKLKGRTTSSSIVTADDPINKQFGLGLTGKEKARVEITRDANGRLISASVLGEFGDDGEVAPSEIAKLQAERDAARAAGREADAVQLDARINQLSQESNLATGQRLVTKPNGEQVLEDIKGGKAETEKEQLKLDQEKADRLAQARFKALDTNIGDSIDMIMNPIQFGGKVIPPDAYLTGLGSLSQYLPGTPAKNLAENITSIRARISFQELQQMREESKTGGALGNVSNMENIMLQNAYYSVNQAQTAEQLVRNLQRLKLMIADIVHVGQMATLNKQVQSGDMSMEEAERQVNSLFGAPAEGLTRIPAPGPDINLPPANADDELKALWPFLSEPARRARVNGEIK